MPNVTSEDDAVLNGVDEFLIEKRGPLSVPPKMGELPKPKSSKEVKKDNTNILGSASESGNSKEKSKCNFWRII